MTSATAPASRGARTWPAIVSLYLTAPFMGEILSGSTPLHDLSQLYIVVIAVGFYGSGALLAREVTRRRGLDWPGLLLLGAAYGILEEGLAIMSWFNPHWPDGGAPAAYGRYADISTVWALFSMVVHAVISIAVPVILVETAFPRVAQRPWVGRRGLAVAAVCLTLLAGLVFLYEGFIAFRRQGYTHPPATYPIALALAVILVLLALRRGRRARVAAPRSQKTPPRLWALRLFAFAMTLLFWSTLYVLHAVIPFPPAALAIMMCLVALAAWRVRAWSRRSGWGGRQRLALASGVVAFFCLLWMPLLEFVFRAQPSLRRGETVVGLVALALVVWLERRAARRRADGQTAHAA